MDPWFSKTWPKHLGTRIEISGRNDNKASPCEKFKDNVVLWMPRSATMGRLVETAVAFDFNVHRKENLAWHCARDIE